MPGATKKCDGCDATIAKDEKKCPACGLDLEELDNNLAQLEQLEKVREKRRKAANPEPAPAPKKKKLFGGLR